MISVSKSHPAPIAVDDNNLNFTADVNILGLTLSRSGCTKTCKQQNKIFQNTTIKVKMLLQTEARANCPTISHFGETNFGIPSDSNGDHFKN